MHNETRPLSPSSRQPPGTNILRVKLTADLMDSTGAKANPLSYDGTNWNPVTGVTITIFDPFKKFAQKNGDELWAIFAPDSQEFELLSVPAGDLLLGKTAAAIAEGSSGTIHIYTGAPGSETDSGNTVTAWNRIGAVASGVWCEVAPINGAFYLIGAEHKARFVWGQLAATLSSGGSANVTVAVYKDGSNPGSTITGHDVNSDFTGASGKHCMLVYDPEDDQYNFVWVAC